MRMVCQVAVTFEFETRPPVTWRGEVEAGPNRAPAIVQRATRQAQRALKPIGWSSMVCCILERREAA